MAVFSAIKGFGLAFITSTLVLILSALLFVYNLLRSFFTSPPKFVRDPTTILITGASSGIGKALADEYSKPGKTIILLGRDESRLADTKKICEKKGARVVTKSIDVTDREGLKKFLVSTDEQYKIDLVVANAGVSQGTLGVNISEIQDYIYTLYDININGVLNTIMPLMPAFKARRQGQIAIVSSLMSYVPNSSAYSSSKAALTSLGLSMRSDFSSYNIHVSVIAPPYVRTPMTDKNKFSMPLIMTAESFAAFAKQGLAADEPIVCPFLPYFATWLLHCIPPSLSSILLQRAPKRGGSGGSSSRPSSSKKD